MNERFVFDRRAFIGHTGKGLLGATLLSAFALSEASAQQKNARSDDPTDETVPVKFSSLKDPSEKPDPEVPSPLRPSKRVGYAIVGLGRLSLNQLLPAIAKCKYAKPVALVSGDAEKARKVALQYGIPETGIYSYENYDTIRDNPDIEAVYIVLPNSMHEEYTIRAAKAGKHVLCEKPMATSSDACRRMIAACREAGRKLMIAYRIQYEPNHRLVRQWTRSAAFGKVRLIDAFNGQNLGDPKQWRLDKERSGGGSLPDIGIYNLNTVRFLLGEEPESVRASIHTPPKEPRFKEVEDTVVFELTFPSGTVATNTCSYSVHESRYYRCHTDNGATFGADNAFSYGGIRLELSQVKDRMEYRSHPSLGMEKDQFALEIDHFSDCIRSGKTPYTPGEEGLQDMVIIEAIYAAAASGQTVRLDAPSGKDAFRGTEPKEE